MIKNTYTILYIKTRAKWNRLVKILYKKIHVYNFPDAFSPGKSITFFKKRKTPVTGGLSKGKCRTFQN
jgi:hypothetical protein